MSCERKRERERARCFLPINARNVTQRNDDSILSIRDTCERVFTRIRRNRNFHRRFRGAADISTTSSSSSSSSFPSFSFVISTELVNKRTILFYAHSLNSNSDTRHTQFSRKNKKRTENGTHIKSHRHESWSTLLANKSSWAYILSWSYVDIYVRNKRVRKKTCHLLSLFIVPPRPHWITCTQSANATYTNAPWDTQLQRNFNETFIIIVQMR